MVSAISVKGEMRFMAIDGRKNSDKVIVFLKHFIRPEFIEYFDKILKK